MVRTQRGSKGRESVRLERRGTCVWVCTCVCTRVHAHGCVRAKRGVSEQRHVLRAGMSRTICSPSKYVSSLSSSRFWARSRSCDFITSANSMRRSCAARCSACDLCVDSGRERVRGWRGGDG
jgi:hypothetical protein